ncbi:C4-dicarboxylate TRAP transporter large permease protein DctM [subsurface metagenome]
MTFFVISMVTMLLLILGGAWIAVAVGVGGVMALIPKIGDTVFNLIGTLSFPVVANFTLMAIPMFLFLGEFLGASGIMDRVYGGLRLLLKGLPGELEQTNIAACGVFAAMAGTSTAGAATMGRVAYPELTRRGYDKKLTLGSVTAGGTLGILIPPSTSFIVIGMIAEESVGQLFMAGLFPGILLMLLFMLYIGVRVSLQPGLVPPEIEAVGVRERIQGLLQIWPFLIVMGSVLGTIYLGVAMPTEAAALGGVGAIVIAVILRLFTWRKLLDSLLAATRTAAMIFLIIMTAMVTSQALVHYGIAPAISEYIMGVGSPLTAYLFIVVLYFILGCFFEPTAMVVLTLPMFVPAMVALGFSKILFGVMVVVTVEIALLTPPVGLNLFVVHGVTGEKLEDIIKGTSPFLLGNISLLAILYVWPDIATWLPRTMFQ